ncbi:MAG: cytochrome C oxidase subunit IV family protein [bacterium]
MAGNHADTAHAVPLRILLGTWGALIFLTWATVAVTNFQLGPLNIVVALGIAVIKSTLVALFFMHLRWDKPFNAIVFVSALLFVFLFITFALLDTKQYQPTLIPGYAPDMPAAATEASPS